MKTKTILFGGAFSLLLASAALAQAPFKVLDFFGDGGFVHGSRIHANNYLDTLAKQGLFTVDKSENASVFTPANLAQYKVLILNNTTELGKLLNPDQRAAVLNFMKTKGFVGFHGSADTKGSWPEYTAFVGGQLVSHGIDNGTVKLDTGLATKNHAIVAGLATSIVINEEWYSYNSNPRNAPNVRVLFNIDESTCALCTKMGDHPISWTREEPTGGRFFYTALGHMDALFIQNQFAKTQLKQAILWAAKAGTTEIRQVGVSPADRAKVKRMDGALFVATDEIGRHSVQLIGLNGKVAASQSGDGPQNFTFGNLKRGSVYSMVVSGKQGRYGRLVAVQ
jgi:type 1 glutamine amidotransferase